MAEAICAACTHPESHHDAGECWTDGKGREIWTDDNPTQCRCSWWEPADA